MCNFSLYTQFDTLKVVYHRFKLHYFNLYIMFHFHRSTLIPVSFHPYKWCGLDYGTGGLPQPPPEGVQTISFLRFYWLFVGIFFVWPVAKADKFDIFSPTLLSKTCLFFFGFSPFVVSKKVFSLWVWWHNLG